MLINVEKIDFKRHPLFTSGMDLQAMIMPLVRYGINHFSYTQMGMDLGKIHLTNVPAFSEVFIRNKFYQRYLNARYDQYQSGYFLGDLLSIDQEFKEAAYAHNIWHYFIVVKRVNDYTEFFYFGAPPELGVINHFYLNNIEILENFILNFKEKVASLFKIYKSQRLFYPGGNDDTGLTEQCFLTQGLFDLKKLSMRERQCLYYVKQGYTAKMIAQKINISYRTVEHHLAHIRAKLNIGSLKHLL